jgi:hypothetical protein
MSIEYAVCSRISGASVTAASGTAASTGGVKVASCMLTVVFEQRALDEDSPPTVGLGFAGLG